MVNLLGLFHRKIRKVLELLILLKKLLDESGGKKTTKTKKNKGWVDKGSEFYNTSMKSLLQDNNIEKYSAHSEGISFVEPQRTKFMSI